MGGRDYLGDRPLNSGPARRDAVSVGRELLVRSAGRGGGRPEVLRRRRPLRRASCDRTVLDAERIDLDVLDVRVRDASEVPGDSHLRPDANEEQLPAGGALSANPNLAEPVVVPEPVGPIGINLEPSARQRVGRGCKPLGRRRQVAVLALGAIGPEQEAAAHQQSEPEQGPDAAENDEGYAARAHRMRTDSAVQTRAALRAE